MFLPTCTRKSNQTRDVAAGCRDVAAGSHGIDPSGKPRRALTGVLPAMWALEHILDLFGIRASCARKLQWDSPSLLLHEGILVIPLSSPVPTMYQAKIQMLLTANSKQITTTMQDM